MSTSSSPRESLNRASVIKWTEALACSQGIVAPGVPVVRAARARRRQRRAPDPPPGSWPLPCPKPASPLPDPALAGLRALPDPAPPYDDEIHAIRTGPEAVVHADDGDNPAHPPRPGNAAGASENPGSGAGGRPDAGPRPAGDGATRPAPTWPSQFAQVLAETLAGSRPSRQLTPWTTERARGHIRRLGPLLAGSQEPRIRRVVASTPSSGVVEMAVVVRFGPRVRALAVRLERADSARVAAWQCTAIEAA
jgi:Family of unknown function (DUF6459)